MPDTRKQRLVIWKQRFRAFANAKATKTTAFIFAIPAAIAIAVGIAVTIYSHLYRMTPTGMPRIPEHLRNLIFMTAGLITFAISIWRARIADKQANIAEKKQSTDRFNRAIEQLGKSDKEFLFMRIGAIQALERIGNDSRGDLPAIIRLLAGFARKTSIDENKENPAASTPLDATEAVAALARLNDNHLEFLREQNIFINLSGSRFHELLLYTPNLTRFTLRYCDLSNADLWGANLSNTQLWDTNLSSAYLMNADLSGADLLHTNLSNANLWFANLSSATLWDADLSNAYIENSNFSGADLSGANIADINRDPETGKIREGTTDMLSKIIYDKDNPPKNCPEGVELPPPQEDED